MSAKSTKSAKKMSVPRSMTEIETSYKQLCTNAGQVQYTIAIQNKELQRLNSMLEAVNNEAAARQQLDKESPKQEPTQAV